MMFSYKIFNFITRLIVRAMVKVEYLNTDNIPKKGPYLICSNHISNMDPMTLSYIVPGIVRFIGKKELFKNKFIAFLFKSVGVLEVDRGKGDTKVIDNCVEIVKNGGIVGIFPEGTRAKNNDGEMLPFKSGAILISSMIKANILPVAVKLENNKFKFRAKYSISYGEIIKYEDLGIIEDDRKSFSRAKKYLKNKIQFILDEL